MKSKSQKTTFLILLFISFGAIILTHFPNSTASANIAMVEVFEPDESRPLPFVFRMIQPYDSIKETLYHFSFYGYYFYGFPYFAFSSLLILPLRFLNQIGNIPLVMTILRQGVSVIPMLAAILLLVYLQTEFRSRWRSIALFIFLISLPAVVNNNFWWHPDSITFLLVILTIFFLAKDNLEFKSKFYLAAFFCGAAAGTKYVGLFFFLTIPTYIAIGYFKKQINGKKALLSAFLFITVMLITILLSNPTLIFSRGRELYYRTYINQREMLSQGYEVQYSTGPLAAYPTIKSYYGSLLFLSVPFLFMIWGIFKEKKSILHIILTTWSIPYSIYILFSVGFKYQYFLPIAIPAFSSIALLLDQFPIKISKISFGCIARNKWFLNLGLGAMLLLTAWQFVSNLDWDINYYTARLNRQETSSAIQFYETLESEVFPYLPEDQSFYFYRDVRMYFPESVFYWTISRFEMLDYAYFDAEHPHMIFIMQQRIYDYTNDNAVANPVDPDQMAESYPFYMDANAGEIENYTLVFRDAFGLAFARNDVYEQFFSDQ